MDDVDDLIDYIRILKKGYDKDLFKFKIEQLNKIADNVGLEYDNFHLMFKIWLRLTIPYSDWSKIGLCLVPQNRVKDETVQLALRWILSAYRQTDSVQSRIALVLDWLTAAMDTDSIELNSLDNGYDIFMLLLEYESLAPYALRLVYVLTKPSDVNRRRVLLLLQLARTRETKKTKQRQIFVLLSLFKSRKPEYVPETIPVVPVKSVFRNINRTLMDRFWKSQARRNSKNEEPLRLEWSRPLTNQGRSKFGDHLIPNMEFVNIGSLQYSNQSDKNYLDFTESSKLLAYSCEHSMTRPARLRAMFCNDTALALLAATSCDTHTFLSYDLYYLLKYCFFHTNHYRVSEKTDFLVRLAVFQRTALQGLSVVTKFLTQYLPFWNDREHFAEVLQLIEWISLDTPEYLKTIVKLLMKYFFRCETLEKCAILNALSRLYNNLAYLRSQQNSDGGKKLVYIEAMTFLLECIGDMTNKALQVEPENTILLYMSVWSLERAARSEIVSSPCILLSPPSLVMSLPLLSPSALVLDKIMLLLTLYKKIYKFKRQTSPNLINEVEVNVLKAYSQDYIASLWEDENVFNITKRGLIFKQIREKLKKKLAKINNNINFDSHFAFAPYTYAQFGNLDCDKEVLFEYAIAPYFHNLKHFFNLLPN